jgi:hypothetical protein
MKQLLKTEQGGYKIFETINFKNYDSIVEMVEDNPDIKFKLTDTQTITDSEICMMFEGVEHAYLIDDDERISLRYLELKRKEKKEKFLIFLYDDSDNSFIKKIKQYLTLLGEDSINTTDLLNNDGVWRRSGVNPSTILEKPPHFIDGKVYELKLTKESLYILELGEDWGDGWKYRRVRVTTFLEKEVWVYVRNAELHSSKLLNY